MLANRSSRRLLGVSIAPTLQGGEINADDREQIEAVAVPDFVTAWGQVEAEPTFVVRLPIDDAAWSITIEPRTVVTTADQALDLSIRREEARVRFAAEITTENGYVFQHHLSAPSDFVVESVSVRDLEGVQRAARWSREPAGTITVFLSGPVEGHSRLELLGTMPIASAGRSPLPRIDVAGAQIADNRIDIFRQPDVLARVEEIKGLGPLEATVSLRPLSDQDRLVARFSAEGEPAATLVVAPNAPIIDGVAVTSVDRRSGVWEATLDYRFEIRDGVVDVLRFDVPRSWSGPYLVEPAAMVTNVDVSDGRRQVVVRPREGMSGDSQLRIRGPLAFAATERPRVPNIVPLAADQVEQFFVLPTIADEERITWETSRVVPAELPEGFTRAPAPTEARQVYRVVGESPQAILGSVYQAAAASRVRMVDVRVALASDGSSHGVASFDLEPAGLARCELQLADGYRLIQATVGGLPVWPQEIGPERWQLSLGPGNLPQRIEVVFANPVGRRFWSWSEDELHAPRLLEGETDIPVERTLWTVFSQASFGADVRTSTEPTTAWRLELARLRSTALMIELGADAMTEQGSDENVQWFQRWARRYHHTLDGAERHAARIPEVRSEVEAILVERPQVARWLRTTDTLTEFLNETSPATEAAEVWGQGFRQAATRTRYTLSGSASSLQPTYAPEPESDLSQRLALAFILGIGAGGVIVALRRGMPGDLLVRWPGAFGVAAGLFWWLWLWPSVLGLVIVLLCLSTLLRRRQ
jgi:hypothetical protein